MASWTSPFPPDGMRRRSRSRSPDRRGYYDREWPPRERDFPEYDRDFEYRRATGMPMRPRSRSPGPYDDRRLKRRRSMSPPYNYERERFDPRPRYGEEYEYHGRYPPSPPRGYNRPYSPTPQRGHNRGPADPREMDYPATFRYYSDWFRLNFPAAVAEDEAIKAEDISGKFVNPMKKRYEEYRRSITSRQIQTLFDHHKTSAWFLERYDPSEQYTKLRARTRKIGWKGKIDEFIANLEQGKYDPSLELDATPAASKSEGRTNGEGSAENGDGDAMNEDGVKGEDIDMNTFETEADDEAGGASAAPATNPDKPQAASQGEEVSIEPEGIQIMIRTIPPDIGRVKIEEVCSRIPGFMYLALGDPMQKRNYYRCGWIRFAEDVNITEVIAKLTEAKIDGFRMQVSHSTKPFVSKARVAPSVASSPERVILDLERIRKMASLLEDQSDQLAQASFEDTEMEVGESKSRGTEAVEARAKQLYDDLEREFPMAETEKLAAKRNSITLDLFLAYLRNAFNCCYYCSAITDFEEELVRKCVKHVRSPPTNVEDPKENRWVEWFDQKIALLVDRDNVDPTIYGGRDAQKELTKMCEPYVKREDEGKFRCTLCTKLFKAESFLEKHIANKHQDVAATPSLTDIPFFNNFALDPHRIQPFNHVPPPNGNTQPPPQAYGLRPARDAPNGNFPDSSRGVHPGYYQPQPMPLSFPAYGEYVPPPDPYYRRRSPPPSRRRLSDRLGEQQLPPLVLTGSEGLPPKPVTVAEPMLKDDRSIPPPPPAKVKEDPRAAAGRKVSYLDMDSVAEGDVELNY